MIHNLKFRSKLILLVALPLCALVAVTVPGITSRLSVVRAETRAQHLQGPSAALTRLVQTLDNENALSTWFLADGDARVHAQLTAARTRTDREITTLRSLMAELRTARADAAVVGVTRLLGRLQRLGTQRQAVDARAVPLDALTGYYQDAVRQVLTVVDAMGFPLQNANEVANLRDFATVLRLAAAAGHERAVLTGGFAQGVLPAAMLQDVVGAVAAQDAYRASFEGQASPALRAAFANRIRVGGTVPERVRTLRSDALAGQLGGNILVAQRWYDTSTRQSEVLFAAAQGVLVQSDHFGTGRKHTAQREMLVYGAGALGALLLAVALAFVIARSASRSLRRLTTAADDVAERQLPQLLETLRAGGAPALIEDVTPIPVGSRDEIGALARSFNAMEQAVVEVAHEQSSLLRRGVSELYVNLARRNQNLLDRQIRMIDALERDEADPDRLGALFGVDHLATRMRRNAESLLVLASAEPARQWGENVSLRDVVRSAASEIADYERVDMIDLDETVQVSGATVVDVTHLVAELLENATAFSPPESRVVVSGRRQGSSYVMSITDDGLGIGEDRLQAANHLLAEPPLPGLALSRSLGLIVVSHLAARTGAHVELQSREVGTVASLTLPASVLVGSSIPAETVDEEPQIVAEPPRPAELALAPPPDHDATVGGATLPQRVPGATRAAAPQSALPVSWDEVQLPPPPPLPPPSPEPVAAETTDVAGVAEPAPDSATVDDFLPHAAGSAGSRSRRARRAPRAARAGRASRRAQRARDDAGPDEWLAPDGWHADEGQGLSWLTPDDAPPPTPSPPAPSPPAPSSPAPLSGSAGAGESAERITAAGLPQRRRAPQPVEAAPQPPAPGDDESAQLANRAPEHVLELLAQFEAGRSRGASDAHTDLPVDESAVAQASEDR